MLKLLQQQYHQLNQYSITIKSIGNWESRKINCEKKSEKVKSIIEQF